MPQDTPPQAVPEPVPTTLLRVDASARQAGSVSRRLADELVRELSRSLDDGLRVIERDLALAPPPFLDEAWVAASGTEAEVRSPEQRAALAASDALVAELMAADVLVIATPIYNFGPPAALKAWIDQVARARLTFRYTESGPVGLLTGKRAYLIVTSGGTPVGGGQDYASGYLRHALGFLGIGEVDVIAADRLASRGEAALAAARARIAALSGAAGGGMPRAGRV